MPSDVEKAIERYLDRRDRALPHEHGGFIGEMGDLFILAADRVRLEPLLKLVCSKMGRQMLCDYFNHGHLSHYNSLREKLGSDLFDCIAAGDAAPANT